MFEQEQQDAVRVIEEFLGQAKLKKGDLVVIGCSTSEIASHRIGSYSNAGGFCQRGDQHCHTVL